MTKRFRPSTPLTLLAVAALGVLLFQGAAIAASHEEAPDAESLWKHLQESDYTSWQSFPGTPDKLYEGQRPHGAKLRTYANDVAAASPDELPAGSIVVKENYTPDAELAAITVMKKVDGYDAENQDWFWVKYDPDGSVAEGDGMELAGKVGSCIGCHASAGGDDYVYTNDE